jgi:hypothetical protein
MPALLTNLVAYSCQLSLIAFCAWLATASSRIQNPRLWLAHFQLTLIIATVLPLLSMLQPATSTRVGLLPIVTAAADGDAAAWSARSPLALVITGILAVGRRPRDGRTRR